MILVDTSIWIDHLSRGNRDLSQLLHDGMVFCHPFVIGELACGNMRNRAEVLSLLAALPAAVVADHREALRLVSDRRLHGKGIGWIDIHLLASALLSECLLWTNDKALRSAVRLLKVEP